MDAFLELMTSRIGSLYLPLKGFGLTLVLGILIQLHFRRLGGSLSNRQSFGPVLPFLALTTFIVISAVKSSFALSLGLVGALSIVRFRTPIKEPEELSYIFLAVATGVGTAAGQLTVTGVAVPLILLAQAVLGRSMPAVSEHVFLSFDVPGVDDGEVAFAAVVDIVKAHAARTAFLRYEMHDEVLHLTAEAELTEPEAMARITTQVRSRYPGASVSFFDESRVATP